MAKEPVRYRERQRLTVRELRGEQESRIEALRRHQKERHGWGVVRGFAVRASANDEHVIVDAGLAVDQAGRTLRLSEKRPLPAKDVEKKRAELAGGGGTVMLCVRAIRVPVNVVEDGGGGPRPRWKEDVLLCLVTGDIGAGDVSDHAIRVLGDPPPGYEVDPGPPGLVPLRVFDENGKPKVTDTVPPWVGVVAEALESPSGYARMTLGTDPDDPWARFRVTLADEERKFTKPVITVRGGDAGTASQLRLHTADSALHKLKALGPVHFAAPPAEDDEEPVERPWQLYRAVDDDGGAKSAALRAELDHPGGDATGEDFRFSIGTAGQGVFGSFLSTGLHSETLIRGKGMHVDGVLRESPIPADPHDDRLKREAKRLIRRSRLAVELMAKPTREPGPMFVRYTVNVSNPGAEHISDLELHQSVTLNGITTGYHEHVLSVPRLAPGSRGGSPLRKTHTFLLDPAHKGSHLLVALLVFGKGPVGNIVYAIDMKAAAPGGDLQ